MRKKTAYTNGSRHSPRHAFLFQVSGQKPTKVWALVKPARKEVTIILTEDDVQRAIDRKGFGDAQNCAGAVCVHRHGGYFPHGISGHFDWLYRRLYVADRNDSIGLPKTCIAYSHNDHVAELFDSQAGLKKLLARLQKNGPITIKLTPPVYRPREKNRQKGKSDAAPKRKAGARGHKLRLTKVSAGWNKEAA